MEISWTGTAEAISNGQLSEDFWKQYAPSDYSGPPLGITSSQCNSPALSEMSLIQPHSLLVTTTLLHNVPSMTGPIYPGKFQVPSAARTLTFPPTSSRPPSRQDRPITVTSRNQSEQNSKAGSTGADPKPSLGSKGAAHAPSSTTDLALETHQNEKYQSLQLDKARVNAYRLLYPERKVPRHLLTSFVTIDTINKVGRCRFSMCEYSEALKYKQLLKRIFAKIKGGTPWKLGHLYDHVRIEHFGKVLSS
ncbi:hypothetical protein FRC18_011627 [Serendipita sp. 400]|nr:hypothetical protein FRC18_011627 [Serendipita sp. 400]